MTRKIFDYKLINKTTPDWIVNGGYFYDPDSDTYIGHGHENFDQTDKTDYTREQLVSRVLDTHKRHPFYAFDSDTPYTENELTSKLHKWVDLQEIEEAADIRRAQRLAKRAARE